MTKKQWKLIWEQEDYPDDPEMYHGKHIELEKSFKSRDDLDEFIKDQNKSARIIRKYFEVKKIMKCDENGNWCEDAD